MKSLFYILVFLSAASLFTSCEKVIEVDVRDADKQLVIEGIVSNQQGGTVVKISRTKNFSATNAFEGIRGAGVQIKEVNGATVQLTEKSAGQYTADLVGTPGRTYQLVVSTEGKTFTAVSTMPAPVAIDSLYVTMEDMFGEKTYLTNIRFTDPEAAGNAYRFVQYQNGKKNKLFTVLNDVLSNGRHNLVQYYNDKEKLQTGDRIRVQLQCIDAAVYKYWYSLWQGAIGEGNSASPANPLTNIRGGALGYFSAQAVSEAEAVVK